MAEQEFHHALPIGAEISGYRIDGVLGAQAYAITYRATEIAFDRAVAIKEFLPTSFAMRHADGATVGPISSTHAEDYAWGLKGFQEEAQILYDLRHTNIVPVLGCFRENGTAYLVMKYQEGERLSAKLADGGTLSQQEIDRLLPPVMDALESVHDVGLQHLDLRPDKILTRHDGTPVILDFGRANQALAQRSGNSGAAAADGYAPHEQYESGDNLGPWSDIYSLGAVLYHCMTGQKPVASTARAFAAFRKNSDPLQTQPRPPAGDYRPEVYAAVEQALQIPETARPQNIANFRALLAGDAAAPVAVPDDRIKPPGAAALVPVVESAPPIAASTDAALPPAARKSTRVAASMWTRPPVLAGVGVICALLLGGIGAATIWSGDGAPEAPSAESAARQADSPKKEAMQFLKDARQKEQEAARRQAQDRRRAPKSRKSRRAAPRKAVCKPAPAGLSTRLATADPDALQRRWRPDRHHQQVRPADRLYQRIWHLVDSGEYDLHSTIRME